MKIFIVRHGQTDWNLHAKMQGHKNIALNKTGIKQAKQAARALANKKIQAIYCSDLKRAKQTAQIISKQTGAPIIFSPALRELDLGEFEGKTREQAKQLHPEFFVAREKNPFHAKRPGGESYADAQKRVLPMLKKILASNKTVCIVSHSGTSRIMLRILLKLKKNEALEIHHPNACTYEVDTKTKKAKTHCNGKTSKGLLKKHDEYYYLTENGTKTTRRKRAKIN